MLAWRLCRRPHADLSGEGARAFGGRWNSPGRPMVYLSEHPALAALEVRVHLDLPFDLLPADYALLSVSVADGSIRDAATATDTVASGNAWLTARDTAVLRVPSMLVPHAFNVLLNPLHPAAMDATIASIEPFRFDPRLWQPLGHE